MKSLFLKFPIIGFKIYGLKSSENRIKSSENSLFFKEKINCFFIYNKNREYIKLLSINWGKRDKMKNREIGRIIFELR